MTYSIGEIAEKMNISVHTLRYYDKEGLLPSLKKTASGRRVFSEKDINLLNIIECLKGTGMSIKDIKQYVDWCEEGLSSVPQRYNMMLQRKKETEAQISDLQSMLSIINSKLDYYKNILETGHSPITKEK